MCPRVTETAGSLSGRLIGLTNTDLFLQVANEQGSFTTPSFVSFTEEERLIGEAAKNQAAMNPKNTVFDIKSVLPLRKANCFIHETCQLTMLKAINRTKIRRRYRQEGY